MLEVLKKQKNFKKKQRGKPNKLCIADQLLMALEYPIERQIFSMTTANQNVKKLNSKHV
jgi:hypothetical protein